MSYTALIIVLVIALALLLWAILSLSIAPKKKPGQPSVAGAGAPSFNIQVRREFDGIHLVIPDVVPMEDGPDSIFPDIINEVEPDNHGLSQAFWQRVASMPDIEDPEQREAIAQALADAGFIEEKDIPAMALLGDDAPPQAAEQEQEKQDEKAVDEKRPELEPAPEPMPEPTPEPEPAPEPAPEPIQEPTPEPVPETPEPQQIPPPALNEEPKKPSSEEDDFVKREFKV